MPKFRKRPVVIEAIQWTGHAHSTVRVDIFMGENHPLVDIVEITKGNVKLIIPTLEGKMEASVGDWIIKGVHGEFYPCKPDIFEKTYEAVSE